MKLKTFSLTVCLLASSVMAGCGMMAPYFTNPFNGQQTMPADSYSRDEVQFFPAGSEEQLPNQKQALKQYKLEQEAAAAQ